MRKLLPVSAIVLAFLLVGLLLYYFFLTPKGCRAEIVSGQSGLVVIIAGLFGARELIMGAGAGLVTIWHQIEA